MKKAVALIFVLIFILSLFACAPNYGAKNNHDVLEYRTTMEYHDDFKILQITDLHFGIESDLKAQLDVVRASIKEAAPDLIILTGDNFMYANRQIVNQLVSTLNEECKALTQERGVLTKFAITFGNHDNQGDYPRYYINEVIASFTTEDGKEIQNGKYAAYVDYEDDNLFGLTNYFIDLVDPSNKNDVKYRIHIIDSNTYHQVGMKYKYDVIHEEQLLHAQSIYNTATVDRDYIGLAFFHIPLCEYKDAWEQYCKAENKNELGSGEFNEEDISLTPYTNNGAYTILRDANISAFFVGHDHINYGDIIYTDKDGQKSIFSYGVKATDQLYHNVDQIGYKTITLKDNITKDEFVSGKYIEENFNNVKDKYKEHYEK